jgi:hypothetical protein
MIAGVHLEFLAQSSLRVSVFVQWVWTYVLVSEARDHLEFPAVGASENRCQCDDFASLKAVAESS